MSRVVAGHRQPRTDGLSVDYADVLRQAVENERWRVLREVRGAVADIRTTTPIPRSYSSAERKGHEVKKDALAAIDGIIGGAS